MATGFDPSLYTGIPDSPPTNNGGFFGGLVAPAIKSGVEEAAGQLSSAVRTVGDIAGLPSVSAAGQRGEQVSNANAQSYANPAYEGSPFATGVGHAVPWAIYNILKMAPQFGVAAAGAAAAPEAALARTAAGALGMLPFSIGQSYQATEQTPGGQGDAGRALMMAPAQALLSSWLPGHVEGLIAKGAEGGIIKRVATAGLVTAAAQAPIAGVSTALMDAANPNLTAKDRVSNIVDAAVGGAVMGGFLGGAGGIRALRRVDPGSLSSEDLTSAVDNALNPPQLTDQTQRQLTSTVSVDPNGRAAFNRDDLTNGTNALDYTTIQGDKQGSLRWAKPYEQTQDDLSRPFRNSTDDELTMAHRVLTRQGDDIKPEHAQILDLVKQELGQRNIPLTEPAVQEGAGAVERSRDDKSGVADQGSAVPAPATPTVDDLLKGISTRKSYAEAKDADELKAKLIDRLQNGSSAKGDLALADRLGVDINAPEKAVEAKATGAPKQDDKTALVTDKTNTPEPAAPANKGGGDQSVDPEFQKQWTEDLSKRQGIAAKDLRDNPPANAAAAQERLYDLLGKGPEHEDVSGKDGYQAVVDLAKQHGVLTDDGKLTEVGKNLARQEFAKEPPDEEGRTPMERAVLEAQTRGLSGDETSAFDRGARGETQSKFGSIAEMKAYTEGKEWGASDSAGDKATQEFLNPEGVKGRAQPEKTVRSASIPDEQRGMQDLNEKIDQVYGSTVRPQEHAQLKRMVREGASAKEIDEAARYFQSGHGALVQEQPEAKPFKGEVVDPTPGRRALLEGRKAARDEAAAQAVEQSQSRGERVRGDQQLIHERLNREAHVNDLRDAVKTAHDNGEITRLDLIKAITHLKNGDVKTVEGMLSGGVLRNRMNVDRREFLAGVAASAVAPYAAKANVKIPEGKPVGPTLKQHIILGDIPGALKALRDGGSNQTYRLIAAKLSRGDWSKVTLERVAHNGEWHGETELNDDGSSTIRLAGDQGLTEETFLHEAIHAYVQQRWASVGLYLDSNKRLLHDRTDRADDVIRHVQDTWNQIRAALEKSDPNLKDSKTWAEETTADPDEMLSWVMTNKSAQEYLKNIDIHGDKLPEGGESMWSRVVKFIADLLGLPYNAKTESALDHVMNAGYAVLDAGAGIKEGDFNVKMAKAIASQRDAEGLERHQYARTLNQNSIAAVSLVNRQVMPKIEDHVDDFKGKAFEAGLRTMPLLHLGEHYQKSMPEIMEYAKVQGERNATSSVLAKVIQAPMDAYEHLSRAEGKKPKFTKMIDNIAAATARGVDPSRTWAQHTWLHKDPQANLLKPYVDDMYRQHNALKAAGHLPIYEGFRDSLKAIGLMDMSERLRSLVTWDPQLSQEVKNFGGDRMAQFRDLTDKHNPAAAAEHWEATIGQQMAAAQAYITKLRGDPTLVASQHATIAQRLSPLENYLKEMHENLGAMRQAPYFHLYREGDNFASSKIRTMEDGKADPTAVVAVAKVLGDAGFDDVHIAPEMGNPKIYMRLETPAQRERLMAEMVKLEDQGLLVKDSTMGGRTAREGLLSESTKRTMEQLVRNIESHPMFATEGLSDADKTAVLNQKQAVIDAVREQWLNALPFNSVNKVLAHRESVQGFSRDMVRGTYFRYSVGAQAIARQWARPYVNDILTRSGARVRSSMAARDPQHEMVDKLTSLNNEMLKRDGEQSQLNRYGMLDMVRSLTNVFYLGFSPSFGLVQLSQMGVLTLPELGAKHGYAKAFGSMAKATPMAFRILREAWTQGADVSMARASDAAITENVLRKAVPDQETRDFIAHIVASGTVDIGSFTRALALEAGVEPNERIGRLMRYSSAIGLYSETFTRLVAALAARDLHGGKMSMPVEEYAKGVINNSLFQYQSWNTAPILGRHGPLGAATPLVAQFQNYNVQVAWKLYREFHDAFINKAATEDQRAEARRFLGGHLITMTALAGTLGLPFAAAAAGAVDKLKDTFWPGDQPFDVNAEYRNYLSDMLGKEVGEVIARGVPRSLDFDFSQRTGEQNLLPFTSLLTSQRNWSDTLDQWGPQAAGAPFSMLSSVLKGTSQMKDGDVLGGMSAMLPSALRNPARAYQLSKEGYVDAHGNKLPIASPTATDVLVQLIGLNPEAKAEYSEARGAQADAKASLTRTSNALKTQLVKAIQSGDNATAHDLIVRAQQFDRANPSYAVLPRLEGSLVGEARSQGTAVALQAPSGVKAKDLYGRGLTRFANIDYQQQ